MPKAEVLFEEGPGTLAGTRALAVSFESISSGSAFWLYDDGTLVRRAAYQYNECTASEGTALASEAKKFKRYDEVFLWAVIQEITGFTFDDDQQPYAVYAIAG